MWASGARGRARNSVREEDNNRACVAASFVKGHLPMPQRNTARI